MVKCAVKKCEAIGKHRFKQLQKIKIVDLPLRDCKDQRLCEEHYIYYYGDEIENEWNGTMYEDGMKYEDVEFLDSSLLFQSENDPVDDKLTHDELTDQDYTSRLMKLFLYLILCFTVFINFVKFHFLEFNLVVRKNKALTKANEKLKAEVQNLEKSISKMYNPDQIHMMKNNLKRPKKWSDETILKSLQYKFACKKGGYSFMLHESHPLPSTRVLRSRLQGINFKPGILEDVFTFLAEKVKYFTDFERECILLVDEISIIEGYQYDIGTQSYIGKTTVPLAKSSVETEATHGLVFVIAGLSSKYKQIVAYELTGNSVDGTSFLDIVMTIVKKAWNIGLRCNGIASDMGGPNGSLWRLLGIKATRKAKIVKNSITHPCDPNRKFWIFADIPHLLKNIVQNIRNNEVVIFDKYIVDEFDLECDRMQCSDFFDLYKEQEKDQLKLAPKLKPHILEPNTFQRMNVPVASNLVGSNVSTGLFYMYASLSPDERQKSSYGTTGWFSQILTRWFKLMTARHYSMSITDQNFEQFSDELSQMMEIIKHAKFGVDGRWKPFQRGFIVSTTSILEMTKFLLTNRGFEYFMPSRVLTDCVENLFSCVRSDNPKPNAIQLRDALKNIAISEYLSAPVSNSSYQWDESKFLSGFLDIVRSVREKNRIENENLRVKDKAEIRDVTFDFDISKIVVNRRERNVLYKICCYILYKITTSKGKLHCSSCLSHCRSPHADDSKSYTRLIRQPNFLYHSQQNYIHYVSNDVFSYFLHMEKIFRMIHPILSEKKKNNSANLIRDHIFDSEFKCDIPNCHSLQKTLTTRFVAFRLKTAGQDRLKKRNFDFSSHTMN